MEFLIKYWRFFAVLALLVALVTGYNLWASHQQGIGEARERVKWEKVIAEQKVEAAKVLAKETAEVVAIKDVLQRVKNQREIEDDKNSKVVSGLTAKLRDLGRLRDPHAGSRVSSSFTAGNAAPGSSDCPDNGAEAAGLLSAKTSDDLRELVLDADKKNLAYISCREDSATVRRENAR